MQRLLPICVIILTTAVLLGCRPHASRYDRSSGGYVTGEKEKGSGLIVIRAPAWTSEEEKRNHLEYEAAQRCGSTNYSISDVHSKRAFTHDKKFDPVSGPHTRGNSMMMGTVQCATENSVKKPIPNSNPDMNEGPNSGEGSASTGSGFFISKSGHLVTNQHVVNSCQSVTVGDHPNKQVLADILDTDNQNDLALLKITSLKNVSAETNSLLQKLNANKVGIKIMPLAADGLLRPEDVELGEDVLVAGYPYGEIFSDSIKVTKGIISANKGLGGDAGQFQMDAAVQPGNSGGPIYDENGNIVGVVVAQLNKMKFAKQSGSIPENVNFGIKASTVRQFLISSGLPTKWSKRSKSISTRELAKIAKRQTVMVMCHR